jgi:hypothetical protein
MRPGTFDKECVKRDGGGIHSISRKQSVSEREIIKTFTYMLAKL